MDTLPTWAFVVYTRNSSVKHPETVPAKRKNNIMHNDDIDKEHNFYDPEHPEWFIYDPELLNAWYWEQFIKEIKEKQ